MVEPRDSCSVLVVDDQPELLEVIRIPLENHGYRVETATNGIDALARLGVRIFDLMITDVMMPLMDGLELCRQVKSTSGKQIPYIIILSAKAETHEKILGLEAGADDYLEKPFVMAELLARVRAGERVVTTQKALDLKQKALEEMLRRDPLTGLYNRRHFEETLQQEYERAVRYQRPLSLLLADVDGFKQINDVHGHLSGDAFLKEVSGILTAHTRHTDTVARYGGDEFAIILPETSKPRAKIVGDKLQKEIENQKIPVQNSTINPTLSFGLTSLEAGPKSWEGMIELADNALYQAKAQGRNRVVAV